MASRCLALLISLTILLGLPAASAAQAKIDPKKNPKVDPKNPRKWDVASFLKEVSALAPEEQVKIVLRKMQDLNPGFREFRYATIVDGVVAKVSLDTYEVEDIAPIRAFEKLVELQASGLPGRPGKLSDISPLAGLLLQGLDVSYNSELADLAIVKDMPLKTFKCGATKVASLIPLAGCQTLGELDCSYSRVTNLKPLKGLKLKILVCSHNRGELKQTITDLSPLQGMLLEKFHCDAAARKDYSVLRPMPIEDISVVDTPITDFTVLKSMPLKIALLGQTQLSEKDGLVLKGKAITTLSVSQTPIKDLNFVKGLPLEVLNCQFCAQLKDLQPLAGTKIHTLYVAGTGIKDLKPLAGVPLTYFSCYDTNVVSLEPLKGAQLTYLDCSWRDRKGTSALADLAPLERMPLQTLFCDNTMVKDLKPLKGTPLVRLHCQNTAVKDLTPLAGTPIVFLQCTGTKVADFSVLKDAEKLQTLHCDYQLPRDAAALKQIKSLRSLNGINAMNKLN